MRACSRLLFFAAARADDPGMEVNPEYQKNLAAAKAEPRQTLDLDAQAAK